jgi:CheY-like chemotaxis protein
MAKIVIIDDDGAMDLLVNAFHYRGHEAWRISDVAGALDKIDDIVNADLVVLDIFIPWPNSVSVGTSGALATNGMELLREIRKRRQDLPIIALSAIQDANVIEALGDDPKIKFISKWEGHPIREVISTVYSELGISHNLAAFNSFIVHGHSDKLKLELKNYIQNTLHLPEPTILHEQPNLGRIILQKFEDYAAASALVFILLTPDDVGADSIAPDDIKRRARQNVIFEMGYFLGILGRQSGRVLLLYQGPLELPSDLSGITYINIEKGIEAAGEAIRREISQIIQ